ncbi:MAG: hypothetical protein WDZ30_11370 [Cellvibrionaceae bacterium]
MEKIIFSQSGVYRLQQLASQVRCITGIRHKLSDESAMIELLRSSASSDHKVIQTYFAAFTSELDEQQRSSLVAKGIHGPADTQGYRPHARQSTTSSARLRINSA